MSGPRWYEGRLWSGMNLSAWLRLLARNRFAVGPRQWPMALAITCFAATNSLLRSLQWMIYGRKVAHTELRDDPIFIIGHWRTGTTMLHELMALDPANRCPTTFECLCPNHFLLSEPTARRWLWRLMPRKRPFDNVKMGFDRPQEDEAAMCNLGLPSPFLTVAFPNRPPQSPHYVDLEPLSPGEFDRWQRTHRRFLQTILFKQPGRLVLKSPQHTFRIRAILKMYPSARFIHIVRDPLVVFPSTVHFWKTMYAGQGLQTPDYSGLEEQVLETFSSMYEKFEAARHEIDSSRFIELRYETLVADPVGEVRKIYEHLELDGFEGVVPALEQYANRSKRYQTNEYEISPETRAKIQQRWTGFIEKYGYG